MIISDLEARDGDSALKEMVGFLKHKNQIAKEKDLWEKLFQRESLGSTAIGNGFAVPHCKLKGLKDPIFMLAVSHEGVEFRSPDGKPSNIFFLVVSAPENPSLNLQILAAVAQLIRKS
ncbi:MAG TPA: PTS sugar transporter subunit IIA, partial [Salinimicrobium catena]|nr:PTS sugar transporter subunit IIA [Salinimicrobium catena]